ncbi:Ribonuclease H domain [Sesbania bispinosa]|nr:Ribonuclease H domain [Sesbania bispinosa]
MTGGWGASMATLKDVDILEAELIAILEGLHICWNLNLRNIKCMTDSTLAVNCIQQGVSNFHQLATLIGQITEIMSRDWAVSLHHTSREGNPCANFMAKMGATSDLSLVNLTNPPGGLSLLLQADTQGVCFPHV